MALIKSSLLSQVYDHARQTYPEECCGFLSSDAVFPCRNIAAELHEKDPQKYPRTATGSYVLEAKDVIFLNKKLKTETPITTIYHSHPNVGAYFSQEDQAFALFGGVPAYPVSYLVVDVRADGVKGAHLYSFNGTAYELVEQYSL